MSGVAWAWLLVINGALWALGQWLAALDYEQKIDEGREIDRRVRRGP